MGTTTLWHGFTWFYHRSIQRTEDEILFIVVQLTLHKHLFIIVVCINYLNNPVVDMLPVIVIVDTFKK